MRSLRMMAAALPGWMVGLTALGMSGLAFSGANPGTGIVGSPHDFSGIDPGNNPNQQICIVCHAPHNSAVAQPPLWNHALSTTQTYQLYTSDTLDATPGQPDGITKLCLSCHDGTVGVDNFGGNNSNVLKLTNSRNLGGNATHDDLTNDHPFSFVYADSASADDGIHSGSKAVTVGTGARQQSGTIDSLLLDDSGKVQCNSCHDVHNDLSVSDNLLKVSINGSALCKVCHDK